MRPVATFRRKNRVFDVAVNGGAQRKRGRGGRRGMRQFERGRTCYGADCFSIARPMLTRLSAMTPRPTQRFIPTKPL
jgi:hypothetical protein